MKVNKRIAAAMYKHASSCYPEEACGFLLEINNKLTVMSCKNVASDPKERFVIGSDEVSKAEDAGEIVAVWHSHPDGRAVMSQTDVHSCNSFGVNWIVFAITNGENEFEFSDFLFLTPSNASAEYVGRPYIYGVCDCFTLCCDYYKRELGIKISFRATGYPENGDWIEKEEDVLVENYDKCGFVDVTGQSKKVGDVILMTVNSSKANHIGVYLGNDVMLHHSEKRLSSKDVYRNGYWVKSTVKILRHKEMVDKDAN